MIIINSIQNLFIFFLFNLFFFISTLGYGKFLIHFLKLEKINLNYFEPVFFGLISYLILGFVFYNTFGNSYYSNIVVLIVGIFLFLFYRNISLPSIRKIIFFLIIFFSGLIISKTHEDFPTYHFFSVQQIFEHKLTIGLPLLNFRFVHASLLSYVQSLYVLPFFEYRLIHLPVFFLYISTAGYFAFHVFNSKKNLEVFFSLFIIGLIIVKFSRLAEHGYDFPAQFMLLVIFHKIYFYGNFLKEIFKSKIFFLFAILIKPTSLLFLPIFLFVLFKSKFILFLNLLKDKFFLFISVTLLVVLIFTSFVRTGCLFYPVTQTCFSTNDIFWSQEIELKKHNQIIIDYAKGFNHQKASKYPVIEDRGEYFKNFHWLKVWIDIHFFYKIFEFLVISFLIIFILYFFANKKKYELAPKNIYLVSILSFFSILFWLLTVPQFRFGFSSILIFLFFLCFLIQKKIFHYKNKSIFIFLVLCILVFNFKNIVRIDSELKRQDNFKFTNFPWYSNKLEEYDSSKISIITKKGIRIINKNN